MLDNTFSGHDGSMLLHLIILITVFPVTFSLPSFLQNAGCQVLENALFRLHRGRLIWFREAVQGFQRSFSLMLASLNWSSSLSLKAVNSVITADMFFSRNSTRSAAEFAHFPSLPRRPGKGNYVVDRGIFCL